MRLVLFAAGLLLSATSLSAASPTDDAKCLILSNGFSKQAPTPQLKQIATLARYYYLGRLSEAATSGKLAGLIIQARRTVTAARSSAEMTACATTMQTSEQALIAAGMQASRESKSGS